MLLFKKMDKKISVTIKAVMKMRKYEITEEYKALQIAAKNNKKVDK